MTKVPMTVTGAQRLKAELHRLKTTDRPDVQQCRPRDGRRFSFILHGLWPQYERGYPENCPAESRPFIPQRTIDGMADIMPSKGLMIHEYRKHGVCSGLDPDGYFALSRKLFEKIRVPKRFHAPDQNQMVDTTAVVDEFVAELRGRRRKPAAETALHNE